jgi:hypothetical protein
VPSLEQILCRGRFRHPGSYRRIPGLSTVCTRTLLTWVRPSFSGFWLVLQRITLIGGKHCILLSLLLVGFEILQLRLQRIALTYRKIGFLLGLLRSYLRLHRRNLLACLRRCRNEYCRNETTGSHQDSDFF